jgi:hypothetical protein
MDNEKRKFLHRALGSGKLDDPEAEKLAYLLATDTSGDEAMKILGIDTTRLNALQTTGLFIRRLDYLKRHYEAKRRPPEPPKSLDEYQDFAMKQLWRLARTARNDKDRVSACKVMAENVVILRKQPGSVLKAEADSKPPQSDALKALTGEGK